jgi:hypothetical protein
MVNSESPVVRGQSSVVCHPSCICPEYCNLPQMYHCSTIYFLTAHFAWMYRGLNSMPDY